MQTCISAFGSRAMVFVIECHVRHRIRNKIVQTKARMDLKPAAMPITSTTEFQTVFALCDASPHMCGAKWNSVGISDQQLSAKCTTYVAMQGDSASG
jgi:hypothetical protein